MTQNGILLHSVQSCHTVIVLKSLWFVTAQVMGGSQQTGVQDSSQAETFEYLGSRGLQMC